MEEKVDERFAFITDKDGNRFQVLRYAEDENGERVPVDWDEEATAALVKADTPNEE